MLLPSQSDWSGILIKLKIIEVGGAHSVKDPDLAI